MLAKLQNMSEAWQKRLFIVMTAAAIVPLYFENAAQIGGVLFLFPLILLTIVAWSKKNVSLNAFEKGWVWVSTIYAIVFVLSFLLRPPYTDDGIWRLSAPGFILLLMAWFWVAIKLELRKIVINSVAFFSILYAVVLLLAELYVSSGGYHGYRLGAVLSDTGMAGFVLPLTAFLFGFLFLLDKNKMYFMLYLLSFLLASVAASRTALVLTVMPILFLVPFLVVKSRKIQLQYKVLLLLFSVLIVGVGSYFTKHKIEETIHDYRLAENNNYYSSLGLRVAMFEVGAAIVEKYPIWGVGPNAYKSELKKYVSESNYSLLVKKTLPTFTHLHNQFLMDFVLSGIAGFISLILFIGYPMQLFWNLYRCGREEEAVLGFGFIAGVWVILFFGAIFTYTYTTIFYMLTVSSIVLTLRYFALDGHERS